MIVANGGDSSTSSAESSFRKIDDVFLQTQTRIWLGEVLQIRLSEQISIADLLANGELLFEVSREVWKMIFGMHMEIKCPKQYEYEPFSSRNSGRYMPYSNVDSFLKICKILGLAGIDLFSPSDVVEKRDTRKVCMCIRALSKKARSSRLNVPDFDKVTYTAAMPTDMVGYIRRSWELSHRDYCSSSSLSSNVELRERSRQRYLNAFAGRSWDLYRGDSEDTERNFSLKSDNSAAICLYSPTSQNSSDLINSPGVSSVDQSNPFDHYAEHLDVQKQILDEEALCINKSTGSGFSRDLYDPDQYNMPPPSSFDSNITPGSLDFSAESQARNGRKSNTVDQIFVDPDLEDESSVLADSVACSTPESNITDDCPAGFAITGHETCTGGSVMLDGKDMILGPCSGVYSFCSEETRIIENKHRSQYINDDDIEMSSTASVSSMSIARNIDFYDHLDAENALKNILLPDSANSESGALGDEYKEGSKSEGFVKYDTPQRLTTDDKDEESLVDMKGMEIVFPSPLFSNNYSTVYFDHAIPYDKNMHMSQINSTVVVEEKEFFAGQSCYPVWFPQWDQKGKCQIALVPSTNCGRGASFASISLEDSNKENLQLFPSVRRGALCLENMESVVGDDDMKVRSTTVIKSDHECRKQINQCLSSSCYDAIDRRRDESDACIAIERRWKDENLLMPTVDNSDGIDNLPVGIAESKPQKRRLLKAVVKGTAVAGAMFLLLHFRKNGREKSSESSKKPNRKKDINGRKFASAKGQRSGGADAVYPAEKLNLGHK